jgi:formate hydrogenlyase subunit 6/NADH:ubiquinone oxidoreductase subunit I
MKTKESTYWQNLWEGIQTSVDGLKVSLKHLKDSTDSRKPIYVDDPTYFDQQTGLVTLQYPHEKLPLPDNARYQLHNEMEDCIVCDKCAKICPVDCIEIEPIKATGVIGNASDGSPIRLYAAKFDIDMAKCCFCGLCTTVCPTECLTMTHEYDFSVTNIKDHNFAFGLLSPEEAEEKKALYEQFMAEKQAFKATKEEPVKESQPANTEAKPKPAFKPVFKKKTEEPIAETPTEEVKTEPAIEAKPKAAYKPVFKKKS